jgi:hypothetical protein
MKICGDEWFKGSVVLILLLILFTLNPYILAGLLVGISSFFTGISSFFTGISSFFTSIGGIILFFVLVYGILRILRYLLYERV